MHNLRMSQLHLTVKSWEEKNWCYRRCGTWHLWHYPKLVLWGRRVVWGQTICEGAAPADFWLWGRWPPSHPRSHRLWFLTLFQAGKWPQHSINDVMTHLRRFLNVACLDYLIEIRKQRFMDKLISLHHFKPVLRSVVYWQWCDCFFSIFISLVFISYVCICSLYVCVFAANLANKDIY